MINKFFGALFLTMFLSACDSEKLGSTIMEYTDSEPRKINLSGGTRLAIGENEFVKVYGYDDCGTSLDTNCISLTGKEHVDVYFRSDGSGVKEQWKVIVVDDSNFSLKRPNGWLVYQANAREQ